MFYDKFKYLCDQKGVSCNKAALEMGLSNATPTKWKKTGATPDSKTLEKVSAYFGVSINELFTGVAPDSPIEFTIPISELKDYLMKGDESDVKTYKRRSREELKKHDMDSCRTSEQHIQTTIELRNKKIIALIQERPELLRLFLTASKSNPNQVEAAIAMLKTLQDTENKEKTD